jgi:hypothetical protein
LCISANQEAESLICERRQLSVYTILSLIARRNHSGCAQSKRDKREQGYRV